MKLLLIGGVITVGIIVIVVIIIFYRLTEKKQIKNSPIPVPKTNKPDEVSSDSNIIVQPDIKLEDNKEEPPIVKIFSNKGSPEYKSPDNIAGWIMKDDKYSWWDINYTDHSVNDSKSVQLQFEIIQNLGRAKYLGSHKIICSALVEQGVTIKDYRIQFGLNDMLESIKLNGVVYQNERSEIYVSYKNKEFKLINAYKNIYEVHGEYLSYSPSSIKVTGRITLFSFYFNIKDEYIDEYDPMVNYQLITYINKISISDHNNEELSWYVIQQNNYKLIDYPDGTTIVTDEEREFTYSLYSDYTNYYPSVKLSTCTEDNSVTLYDKREIPNYTPDGTPFKNFPNLGGCLWNAYFADYYYITPPPCISVSRIEKPSDSILSNVAGEDMLITCMQCIQYKDDNKSLHLVLYTDARTDLYINDTDNERFTDGTQEYDMKTFVIYLTLNSIFTLVTQQTKNVHPEFSDDSTKKYNHQYVLDYYAEINPITLDTTIKIIGSPNTFYYGDNTEYFNPNYENQKQKQGGNSRLSIIDDLELVFLEGFIEEDKKYQIFTYAEIRYTDYYEHTYYSNNDELLGKTQIPYEKCLFQAEPLKPYSKYYLNIPNNDTYINPYNDLVFDLTRFSQFLEYESGRIGYAQRVFFVNNHYTKSPLYQKSPVTNGNGYTVKQLSNGNWLTDQINDYELRNEDYYISVAPMNVNITNDNNQTEYMFNIYIYAKEKTYITDYEITISFNKVFTVKELITVNDIYTDFTNYSDIEIENNTPVIKTANTGFVDNLVTISAEKNTNYKGYYIPDNMIYIGSVVVQWAYDPTYIQYCCQIVDRIEFTKNYMKTYDNKIINLSDLNSINKTIVQFSNKVISYPCYYIDKPLEYKKLNYILIKRENIFLNSKIMHSDPYKRYDVASYFLLKLLPGRDLMPTELGNVRNSSHIITDIYQTV